MDLKTIGKGQATLSYATRNELGYRFKTHRNIVADIETSGLDPTRDNIIEIAALKVNLDNGEEFHRLIQNERELPAKILQLTGLTH